jgi:hypothetical protein
MVLVNPPKAIYHVLPQEWSTTKNMSNSSAAFSYFGGRNYAKFRPEKKLKLISTYTKDFAWKN